MRGIAVVLVLVAGMLASATSAQEAYPNRPITIVNPFPPGGIADFSARPLAALLERSFKQPVVIAHKVGASGGVGSQFAAVAKPDGHTLMVHVVSISSTPEVDKLFGRSPIYTRDQFVGIARFNADPPMLVVNAQNPWKSVKDLLEDARRRPNEITYASSGPYGASHVAMHMLLHAAGDPKMKHLPTTGGAPAMTAVLGNHAQLWTPPPAIAAPHIAAGTVRPLASFGATRLAAFPDVPTLKELGYDIEYYLWTGLFTQKGVPAPVFAALRDAVRKAVEDPEFKMAMDKAKTPIAYQDAPEFNAWWAKDAERIAAAIQQIGKTDGK